ncbi:run domain Beclin-1-interacting and cysteine-rich domain-containing protein [Nephila pilipes]|uniref:Run domain Beclin-1-interacting and cysteine-rich domain-containing protein n=1 Tax=Nephila pilipes TaxID=299642 RepID=A0A8X6MYZ0_NEPPI|nr:run domain Beclin-1-interacting and cysteine-rich domain-containing protein [Nephila pilipes]
MPLNSFDGNPSVKSGNLPVKSPRYTRKKRLSSQTRRSHSGKDKYNFKHELSINETPEESLKSILFYERATGFVSSASLEKFTHSTSRKSDSFRPHKNLIRSLSFPMVYSEPVNKRLIERSVSSHELNTSLDIPLSQIHNQPKTSNSFSQIPSVKYEKLSSYLFRSNSAENNISEGVVSRRSSTTTVCERNNSVDSAFSQISVIDMKEVESLEVDNKHSNPVSGRKAHHSRSKSDVSVKSFCDVEIDYPEVFSLPSSFSEISAPPRKGKQVVPSTECFFPCPHQGQNLFSFLSSNEFNISAELDRENAHFSISEALIAVIERVKCSRTLKIVEEENESDEEIRNLKQRIRIRKRERQREKTLKNFVLLSDGRTDTTTSQSASPPVSSQSSDFDVSSIGSEDEVEDLEITAHTDSNLSSMNENGLSLSMASLYSDADILKGPLHHKEPEKKFQDSDSNSLSAESVALSLLRKFSKKHLPNASELQWLVSEQDAPQRLLPLPDSYPVSPDVIEEEYKLRLRGNFEWAPPRPQIIFSILPSLSKKDIMEKQKYRCAGCGMKIEKSYINRFRYCNYFGKYFCQCCHSNGTAYIPGRIIWKWDFTKYYVSKFAWGLLDQMFSEPLFNVEDINNNLYHKVRLLEQSRILRTQLFYLKNFMNACRKAENIQDFLKKENQYILHEPHVYSLNDFVQVKSGDFVKYLRQLVNPCIEHVKQCILCQAKGFICEICGKDKDIIFPFQLEKVILCQVCGCCFHKKCFKNVKCPKCERIAKRKSRLKQEDEELFV